MEAVIIKKGGIEMNFYMFVNAVFRIDWSRIVDNLHNYDLMIKILLAIAEVAGAFLIGSLVKTMILKMANKALNKGIMTFFASFCNVTIKIVGIIVALDQIGVAMNIIIGALSAFGVGISLALKDNMASVASGLQILLTKPFKVGDIVKVGHHEGRVESIEMTYITLLTRDNQIDIVPNNKVISKTVKNYSNEPNRKINFEMDVPNDQVSEYIELLEHSAEKCSLINSDPKPVAFITDYQLNQATLNLTCYAKQENYWDAYKQILSQIHLENSTGKADAKSVPANPAEDSGPIAPDSDVQNTESNKTDIKSAD